MRAGLLNRACSDNLPARRHRRVTACRGTLPPFEEPLYVENVRKPWSHRMRRALAADTAAWAKAGRLTSNIQRPTKTDAALSVASEGCLGALSGFGI